MQALPRTGTWPHAVSGPPHPPMIALAAFVPGHRALRWRWWLLALVVAPLLVSSQMASAQGGARDWGLDALARTRDAFRLPESGLYAETARPGNGSPSGPAFMWGCGVQLAALAAAARLDRKAFQEPLRSYAQALQSYWSEYDGVAGYAVLPNQTKPDRYYDDNAWMVLALCDAYDATRDRWYLRQAEATYRFVLSGEDDKLGGGLYWREQVRRSKNTCANAPAIVSGLRLYMATRKRAYRQDAERLYQWTNAHLQDADGLYFDNIRLDGSVEKTKWSYNSGVMLKANCLLYQITKQDAYKKEAERIAAAAETRWVRPSDGAVADEGAFAYLLLDAFLSLYDVDRNEHWLQLAGGALSYLHSSVRDPNGFYGHRWDAPDPSPLSEVKLLWQASAARAFLVAARYPAPPNPAQPNSGSASVEGARSAGTEGATVE